jgi:hypothetical protein
MSGTTIRRGLVAVVGGLLLVTATGCDGLWGKKSTDRDGSGERPGGTRIRIHNMLDVGQVRETVTITVGGVTKTIKLDERTPRGYVDFFVPGPGDYLASFQATTQYYHHGRLVSVGGQGQGTIECRGNAEFGLVGDHETNPFTLGLVPLER